MSTNKSVHHETHHIIKSASIIGLATLSSRLLGFLRDIVIARLFGVYLYAQAFVIAFKIPNLFRDLLGEGSANAAFVPVFSEYSVKKSKEEFWELANIILNILLVILTAVTLLGIIFSPVIVRMIAPGFIASPEKLETTIRLTQIIFPYILLISLAAYSMGILNSLKHFTVPAFAPCLLNISIIVFAMLFGESITGLASGILVGGILQLAVQIPVLYKKGFRPKLIWNPKHPTVKTIGQLLLPRIFSSSIYQLNNFVDTIFGSLAFIVGEGAVAVLYFAYRLILFPVGIFSNAISQAILPTMSHQALEKTHDNLRHTLSFSLGLTFFVMIPSSVAFMVLTKPIISTLFQGGKFDAYSTDMTVKALFFYSIGLFAYGGTKILQSCFFALKDTVTPTKLAGVSLGVNIILNALLMFPMKLAGLALANSLSGINTFIILFLMLKKKIGDFRTKELIASFIRILLASLLMGIVCYFASAKIIIPTNGVLAKFAHLFLLLIIGFISYLIFCFILRVPEMHMLWNWLVKREKLTT